MLAAMRTLACLAVLAACSGPAKAPKSPGNAAAPPVPGLAATAFVPAQPTYLFAAPKVRDAQLGLRHAIDGLGVAGGFDSAMAAHALQGVIDVDPLDPDPASAIGVDLDGSLAIFSEDLDPTVVVHLSAPEATAQFFERERKRGLVTQSVIVDGVEVFTAKLAKGVDIGWAVDHDWLFVHLAAAGARGPEWFQHARHPAAPAWLPDWQWAASQAKGALTGFVKLRELVAKVTGTAQNAAACAKLVAPIARLGASLDADPGHVTGRLMFDVGASARAITASTLAPPPGWAATAANAALAVQLNVDADAVATWVEPCVATFGGSLDALKKYGVRAARAMLLSFDPDEASGTGAVAIDLDRSDFLAKQLDRIPMRSHFESDRTFGSHKGHHVKIPFTVELDYLLEDKAAAVAMGDGVLAQIYAPPAMAPPPAPLAELDIAPGRLSPKAWEWLLGKANVPGAREVAEHLQRWRDGHVTARVEGDSLVLEASGNLK